MIIIYTIIYFCTVFMLINSFSILLNPLTWRDNSKLTESGKFKLMMFCGFVSGLIGAYVMPLVLAYFTSTTNTVSAFNISMTTLSVLCVLWFFNLKKESKIKSALPLGQFFGVTLFLLLSLLFTNNNTQIQTEQKQAESSIVAPIQNTNKIEVSTLSNPEQKEIVSKKNSNNSIYYTYAKGDILMKKEIENMFNNYFIKGNDLTNESQYTFWAEYEKINSDNYYGYVYTVETYLGGSHSSFTKIPFIFSKKNNNRIKINPLEYVKNLQYVASSLAYQKMADNETERYGKSANLNSINLDEIKNGTIVNDENYKIAWINGASLFIYFEEYQLGPYASTAGGITIEIPLGMDN